MSTPWTDPTDSWPTTGRAARELLRPIGDEVQRLGGVVADHEARLRDSGTSGTGARLVSGTVTLSASGAAVREFVTTGPTTFTQTGRAAVTIDAGTVIVWYRNSAGAWGHKIVDGWTVPATTGGTTPPADTTAPTGASLAVTGSGDAGTTRTLTVSGATDPGSGLHVQPYAFSIDGGTTWSSWQASASWTTDSLPAGTYQPRARVRDNASTPNVATVSAENFTVNAAPAPRAVVVADTFDRADTGDSNDIGTTTTGSKPWTVRSGQWRIYANHVVIPGQSGVVCVATVDAGASEATVAADITVGTTSVNAGVIGRWASPGNCLVGMFSGGSAPKAYITKRVNDVETVIADSGSWAASPGQTYRLELEMTGTTVRLLVDGVVRATATTSDHQTATGAGLWAYTGGGAEVGQSIWDNFEVRA